MAHLAWRVLGGIAILALALTVSPLAPAACPFCVDERGPTLVGDFVQASMVLYGSFTNPKVDNSEGLDGGTSDFVIEKVLKKHDVLKDRKIITLPRYIPANKNKFVIFCDVYKDIINPYRGEEVPPGSDLVEYLTGSLKFKDAPIGDRLRHCFDYLNSTDLTISMDAYREFAKADYSDYKAMAKSLPAETVAGWLKDPKTPSYRYGLYGSLLGHCGDPAKHAPILLAMLNDPEKRQGSGIDGLMAGYVLLKPSEGWDYMKDLLKDDKQEFYVRYAVVRTLRFFWDNRSDVLDKEKLKKGMGMVVEIPDLADFGIDDLRLWKAWEMTDRILDLFKQDKHNHPVIKRAVLRFALTSPSEKAKAFVEEQRRRDATWVQETLEMLRIDTPAAPAVEQKK